MRAARVPGVQAPWIVGLVMFLALAAAAGTYLARPRVLSPAPQSVLDSRRESTVAASQAIARSLNGELSSLAEIATVVDESMRQRNRALLIPFQHRVWRSLYVLDRTSRAVVAQVGEPAQPAVLGEPVPGAAGMRLAQVGTAHQVVQYTPVGTQYLLVGHLDPSRFTDLLAVASPEGAWLLDRNGAVIAGPATGAPTLEARDLGEGAAGSRARHMAGRLQVTSWTSLVGAAPANTLGWTVASNRATAETAAPADDSRGRATRLAVGLAVLVVIVFTVLYLSLLRPVRRLGRGNEPAGQAPRRALPKHGEAGHVATVLADTRPARRHFPVARVTWAASVATLLCAAAVVATAPTTWLVEDIPASVAAEQQARTALAARQLQRALDSGISDLGAVAAGIRRLADADTPNRLLSRLLTTRPRYRGAAYLAATGEVRAKAGADVDPTAIKAAATPAVAVGEAHGVAPRVFVSVPVTGRRAGRLVAELTPATLIRPLSLAGPGNTRLLNAGRQVIGATTGFTAFEPLTRPDLALAARTAAHGPGHSLRKVDGQRHLVSWAPVTSTQPTRQTGLTVVTDRPETSLTLPHSTEKRELLLLGVLIATLTVVVFGWLYAVIVSPLAALAKAAGRLHRGETGAPVLVRRHDQLGLIARDLERIRRDMLRSN